jgi:hypothetical protein
MNDQSKSVSFSADIRPLFREVDVEHMKPLKVMLDDYNYMSDPKDDHDNATNVQDYLVGNKTPRMPMGGPYWSKQQLDLYNKWMTDGYKP